MATETYRAKWGSDWVYISANWAEASSPVTGVGGGRQVGDFGHSPRLAMERALYEFARDDGMDEDEQPDAVERAMETMCEVEAAPEQE
jgi:hypothetical protein